VSEGRKERN